jgi:predicted PurR-regulated permease PerM
MLGLSQRVIQAAWTLFVFALLLIVIYRIGRTLVIFALALIFAHLLAPVVEFIERHVPERVPRIAVLATVYVVLVGVLISTMIPISSRIGEEAAALANRLPEVMQQDPLGHLPMPGWLEPLRPQLTAVLRDRLGDLDQTILPLLSKASTHIITGIGAVMGAVLIPILSFFFLKDGAAIRDAIVEAAAGARRELIDDIFSDLHLLLAQYIRALVILSIATFIFYMTFLSSMRVPYPILLSGLAALLEYIPVVGPLTASAVILLVAGFAGYQHLVWILVFLVVYRIFQDYVLSPYLLSSGVKIHPLLVLFGVLAGEQLAGIPGMFFSVPVIAALRLILIRLGRRRMRPASL